jgi:hypothetical protein
MVTCIGGDSDVNVFYQERRLNKSDSRSGGEGGRAGAPFLRFAFLLFASFSTGFQFSKHTLSRGGICHSCDVHNVTNADSCGLIRLHIVNVGRKQKRPIIQWESVRLSFVSVFSNNYGDAISLCY